MKETENLVADLKSEAAEKMRQSSANVLIMSYSYSEHVIIIWSITINLWSKVTCEKDIVDVVDCH